jgi:glycosyltransferase involved in cell wall biosynthesis
VLTLGADFNDAPRVAVPTVHPTATCQFLCVGILEPRKNQGFLLDVCEDLWTSGLTFELHVVGRVNPHFGKPVVSRLQQLRRRHPKALHFHEAATDTVLAQLYHSARATVFPTIAEGCGLPLLESLWMGVPCVCSDLPVLRENADGGGCIRVEPNNRDAWKDALRRMIVDNAFAETLAAQATSRPLPTWNDAAQTLAAALR